MTEWTACLRIDIPESYHLIPVEHYEDLRDELDRGVKGWREFPLVEHPSGRCFVRLEMITSLGLYSASWCEAKNAQAARERLSDG
jgi:hypothetical protein